MFDGKAHSFFGSFYLSYQEESYKCVRSVTNCVSGDFNVYRSFLSKCSTTLKFVGIYTVLNKYTGQCDKPSLSSNPLRCFLTVLKIGRLYILSFGPYKEFWSDMDLEARACVCRTHTFKEGDEGGFWGCSFYGSTG